MEIFDVIGKEDYKRGETIIIKKNGAYQICDVIKGQGSPNIYFLTYTEEKKYEYINSLYFKPKGSLSSMMILDTAKVNLEKEPEVKEVLDKLVVEQ